MDTILDLKDKIDEEGGADPARQSLYYKGYLINEDDTIVEDLVGLGEKTFILVLPKAGKSREITSDREKFLITGSHQNFQSNWIPKNKRTTRISLISKKFGIVYNTESNAIGKRVYHVEVFEINEKGSIDIKTVSNEGEEKQYKVTMIDDKNPDDPGKELKGVMKTYDESEQVSTTPMLTRMETVSKIFGNVGRFISAIGDLVFGGKKHMNVFNTYFYCVFI